MGIKENATEFASLLSGLGSNGIGHNAFDYSSELKLS
jgi:hypothetical protein